MLPELLLNKLIAVPICGCSGAEIAQSLKAHLAASQALQQLPQLVGKQPGKAEPQQSQEAARLLEALLEATAVDMGKRGVISAMLSTPGAFQAILSLIKVAVQCADNSDQAYNASASKIAFPLAYSSQ